MYAWRLPRLAKHAFRGIDQNYGGVGGGSSGGHVARVLFVAKSDQR